MNSTVTCWHVTHSLDEHQKKTMYILWYDVSLDEGVASVRFHDPT